MSGWAYETEGFSELWIGRISHKAQITKCRFTKSIGGSEGHPNDLGRCTSQVHLVDCLPYL